MSHGPTAPFLGYGASFLTSRCFRRSLYLIVRRDRQINPISSTSCLQYSGANCRYLQNTPACCITSAHAPTRGRCRQRSYPTKAPISQAGALREHATITCVFQKTGTGPSGVYPKQPSQKIAAIDAGSLPVSRARSIQFRTHGTSTTAASTKLSTRMKATQAHSLRQLLAAYLALAKPRLTFLMVLTTASAYSLYPVPSVLLHTATGSPSLSALTLIYLTAGTGFCSAAANSLNMMLEPEHDAKMSRTQNRPLVRGLVSRRGALIFALVTGSIGVLGLYVGVNPTVSFLGVLNIFLYAGLYTPLKRISVLNTWVGAVVGAIPPLMGWAAGAGQRATGTGDWKELLFSPDSAGGWLLAVLLFAWQFHHFNALSWTVRHEYKYAGYRMLAWVNEAMNARIALRYALLCFPACWGLSIVGVTDWGFVLTSSAVNLWISRAAWRFYKLSGHKGSARGLFWAGVWQLPGLMVLAMAQKKGLWEGLWSRLVGDDEIGEEAIFANDAHIQRSRNDT